MTHVQISINPGGGGTIVVDGHDISEAVLAKGLTVDLSTDPAVPSTVHVNIKANALDVDLPDAVLTAVRKGVEAGTRKGMSA